MIKSNKIILFVSLLVFLTSAFTFASERQADKLRVGYFEFDGYLMIDANGNRSGYGYDMVQLIRFFLACNYEYVGFDKGWPDMLPMLERGEIDIVTSVVKTPENLKKFDLSSIPIGISSVLMTVDAKHCKYLPKDYDNWNGMRIGMISNNSNNKVFADFAQKHGFTYKPVYFNRSNELRHALQKGEFDAIVTGSLRRIDHEQIYEQLDIQPFYIIVKKGNKVFLDRINAALKFWNERSCFQTCFF